MIVLPQIYKSMKPIILILADKGKFIIQLDRVVEEAMVKIIDENRKIFFQKNYFNTNFIIQLISIPDGNYRIYIDSSEVKKNQKLIINS